MDFDSPSEIELIDRVRSIYPEARCLHEVQDERHYYRIEAEGKLWPLESDPTAAWRGVLRDIAVTLQRIKGNPKLG